MPCQNCGTEVTIRAHLIPQAFVREIRGNDTDLAVTNADLSKFQPSKNGHFDDAILCVTCDNRLGNDENYSFMELGKLRKTAVDIVDSPFEVVGINGDRILRFALGIIWKYTLTRHHYGRIDIGRYSDLLRAALFGEDEVPLAINAFLMKLHSGDDVAYFFRAPIVRKYGGVNFARFSVGGFIFMLKLDQRNPANLPPEAWLRGNSNIMVPAIRFDEISEGKMFLSARRINDRLNAFLHRTSRP